MEAGKEGCHDVSVLILGVSRFDGITDVIVVLREAVVKEKNVILYTIVGCDLVF